MSSAWNYFWGEKKALDVFVVTVEVKILNSLMPDLWAMWPAL